MNLAELIQQLEEIVLDNPELADREVMIATQPSYPLTAVIDCISLVDADDDADEDEDFPTVWIATSEIGSYSNVSPYAPQAAWDGDR